MITRFEDRSEAGKILAEKLRQYADRADVVVLALPRGGVPVAFEVAKGLHAPLDVLIVRKLGVPGREELAFGAIASGGAYVLNEEITKASGISLSQLEKVVENERKELERRERLYRADRQPHNVRGKTVIVVDDGLATGSTVRAAIAALKQSEPKEIVVAVPVGARQVCDEFKHEADTWCVCAMTPEPFFAVGLWYKNFDQTTDEEVKELVARAGCFTQAVGSNAL